jgi:hypothetical protein
MKECPLIPEHSHGSVAALFVGADGRPGGKCLDEACDGKTWKDFADKIEPSWRTQQSASDDEAEPEWPEPTQSAADVAANPDHARLDGPRAASAMAGRYGG